MPTLQLPFQLHLKNILLLVLLGIIFFLLNMGILVAQDIFQERKIWWSFYIINEGTGSLASLLLLLPLVLFFHHFALDQPNWWLGVGLYLLVSLIYGLVFTSLMYGLRVPLYYLTNIPIADKFNNLPVRYLMEYFKQFVFFWSIYIGYRFYSELKKRKEEAVKAVELQQLLTQTELQALRARLNPHFFFNTLNTISSLVYDQPAKADQLIVKLSQFLRKNLALEGQSFHNIQDEINLTQQYVNIMQYRFEDRLTVRYDIATDIENCSIPVMLLQPLVENSIQYSLQNQDKCTVNISIIPQDGKVICVIKDNGPGLQGNLIKEGIGWNTIIERLERLYLKDYTFVFQNLEEGGLKVEIRIPIKRKTS